MRSVPFCSRTTITKRDEILCSRDCLSQYECVLPGIPHTPVLPAPPTISAPALSPQKKNRSELEHRCLSIRLGSASPFYEHHPLPYSLLPLFRSPSRPILSPLHLLRFSRLPPSPLSVFSALRVPSQLVAATAKAHTSAPSTYNAQSPVQNGVQKTDSVSTLTGFPQYPQQATTLQHDEELLAWARAWPLCILLFPL